MSAKDPDELWEAANYLLEKCDAADAQGELIGLIDGSILDRLRAALAARHGTEASAEQGEWAVHSATCPRCFLSFTCTGDTRPVPATSSDGGLRERIADALYHLGCPLDGTNTDFAVNEIISAYRPKEEA